jgi:protein involved in polysaccharide export with SLBB domain
MWPILFNLNYVNRILAYWILVLSCFAYGQTGSPLASTSAQRDKQGFLPVATPAASESATTSPLPKATLPPIIPASPTEPQPLGSYVLDDKHKLLPGDRVSFQIVEDRTNALPLLIAESSELDVPYIGRVSVAGKTCRQAADDIRALLEKDYYYKATVIIGLDALTKVLGKVYVFGPVRNPGPVEIPANENFTAGKAILRVGGFGDFANRRKVQIVRHTDTGNKTIVVNMENVLEKGKTEEDITLEPEDFIIVPQRAINW